MTPTELVVVGLALWRASSLLTRERGPGRVFVTVRRWAGITADPATGEPDVIPEGFWPEVMSCPWCVSVWLGAAAAAGWGLAPAVTWWLCLPLALSAAVIVIERIVWRS